MFDSVGDCPVCGARLNLAFTKTVLGKHDVNYFECSDCKLLKTEESYWRDEAYSFAIADMDTGLVQRNIEMAAATSKIIEKAFNPKKKFLDYGGGYGLFVRLMRDRGFDFYWDDKYCTNIFARFFSHSAQVNSYEMVTAFEFFEHVADPVEQAKRITELTDNILFTTELRPDALDDIFDWWYLAPETGQHITFYSIKTLNALARNLGMYFYTNGQYFHMLSRTPDLDVFSVSVAQNPCLMDKLYRRIFSAKRSHEQDKRKVESLTWSDHLKIRDLLRHKMISSESTVDTPDDGQGSC